MKSWGAIARMGLLEASGELAIRRTLAEAKGWLDSLESAWASSLVLAILKSHNVSESVLKAQGRVTSQATAARDHAAWALHKMGLPYAKIADILSCDVSAAPRMIRRHTARTSVE